MLCGNDAVPSVSLDRSTRIMQDLPSNPTLTLDICLRLSLRSCFGCMEIICGTEKNAPFTGIIVDTLYKRWEINLQNSGTAFALTMSVMFQCVYVCGVL